MSVKIVPRIPRIPKSQEYANLKRTDFFLCGDELCMKCDGFNQRAVSISTGIVYNGMCDYECIPLDVEIRWSRKPKVKKGKNE